MITNISKGTVLALRETKADNFFARAMGLMGRSNFSAQEAMVIVPCRSVHTFFMRFPIDIIFLDKDNRIIEIIESMKPFRLSRINYRAYSVVELAAGTIHATQTTAGDSLLFK